jgi:hypothetical protein
VIGAPIDVNRLLSHFYSWFSKARNFPQWWWVVMAVGILLTWPYKFVASPNCILRVVNDRNEPLSGVRVIRTWQTTDERQGTESVLSNSNCEARFKQVSSSVILLKRVLVPALALLPMPGAPGGQIYGISEFKIDPPLGYKLKLNTSQMIRENEVWEDANGVCVRDPGVIRQYYHDDHVELYFFRYDKDFELSLFDKHPDWNYAVALSQCNG